MSGGILLVSDQHTGVTQHDCPDEHGNPSWRRVEAERIAEFVHAFAAEHRCRVVSLGDFYDSRRPPAWAYKVERKYPEDSICLRGNHDTFESDARVSPVELMRRFQPVMCPQIIQGYEHAIIALPWFGRSAIARDGSMSVDEQHARMEEHVAAIVSERVAAAKEQDSDAKIIVVAHMMVAGAQYNSGTQPMLGQASEFMVPAHVLAQPGVDAVYLGHVHKPQEFESSGIPVTYVGASVRHDFGDEANECRGIYLEPGQPPVDVALPATKFLTISVNEDKEPADTIERMKAEGRIQGAVVRLKGELPAGTETTRLLSLMTQDIIDYGALRVAPPAVTTVRHTVAREHTFTMESTPDETLSRFIDLAGGDYAERKDELLAMHATLQKGA